MILEIFIKKKPGGKPVETNDEWKDSFIEGDEINLAPGDDGKIKFCAESNESVRSGTIDLKTHGYHIYNNEGAIIKKLVTAIGEGQ